MHESASAGLSRQPTSARQPVLPLQPGFYKNLRVIIPLIFTHLRREARVMRRIFAIFFGFGLGLVAMFLTFQMHVVKTDADWHFVRKQETQFADFYVDIRKWDRDEWARHPDFQQALVAAGKTELMPAAEPEDMLNEALRTWDTAKRVLEAARQ